MSGEDRAREDRVRDFEEHDLDRAQAFVDSRAELAEKIFSQAINSLWLGNSGAVAPASVSLSGAWSASSCWRVPRPSEEVRRRAPSRFILG
jgi:hypothetical protein